MSADPQIVANEIGQQFPTSAGRRSFRIAVAGNPNAGKTTLFNLLTGLRYKVANYAGVTVEKKEGSLQGEKSLDITVIDLPGIYSLFGQSIDEVIATQCLSGQLAGEEVPDLIVSVVDSTNLERNLYLTSQLIDLGIPVILALNMLDIAEKRGIIIRNELLARALGVSVVPLVAKRGQGVEQLKKEIRSALLTNRIPQKRYAWGEKDSMFLKYANDLGRAVVETKEKSIAHDDFVSLGACLLSGAERSHDTRVLELLRAANKDLTSRSIDPSSYEAESRYRWIDNVVHSSCVRAPSRGRDWTEAIDRVVTHKIWGSFIFLFIMAAVFQSIFSWASVPMEFIDESVARFGGWLGERIPPGQFNSLIVDGVVAGVGSILVFIPQIAILYFFIGLLEDSGYLSRAAFLMDRIMRRFGLQGRSFIPLLSSFACAIPGIMSARVIPSFSDRLTTILIAPLMSCSARLPVYALLIAAFVPSATYLGFISLQGIILFGLYILGIVVAALVALALKSTLLRGQPSHLVMELPPYHLPSLKDVSRNVLDRVLIFLKDAGTVILACCVVLWFLASYPRNESGDAPDVRHSYAGHFGSAVEPVIQPLGFDWRIGVSLLASFAAREVFVSSMATVYNLENVDERSDSLINELRATKNHLTGENYGLPVALSLMVFYCFACQCMSTLAVCRRETGSWRWPAFMFLYMMVLAYAGSLITYQLAIRW